MTDEPIDFLLSIGSRYICLTVLRLSETRMDKARYTKFMTPPNLGLDTRENASHRRSHGNSPEMT